MVLEKVHLLVLTMVPLKASMMVLLKAGETEAVLDCSQFGLEDPSTYLDSTSN